MQTPGDELTTDRRRIRGWTVEVWGPWLVALLASSGYAVLWQPVLYGDAPGMLELVVTGNYLGNTRHYLYTPLIQGMSAALGMTPFVAGSLLSIVGGAVGAGSCGMAACRLGAVGWRPSAVTLLVATCPTVVFFSTVVEYHAFFSAFVGLAMWCLAGLVSHPSVSRAVACGAASALAWFAHESASLLPFAFAVLTVLPGSRRFRAALWAAVVGGVHLAVVHGGSFLIRWAGLGSVAPGTGTENLQLNLTGGIGRPWSELLTFTTTMEWLVPLLPLSLLAVVGLWVPKQRFLALAIHVAAIPYIVAGFVLVRGGHSEFGAYSIALVGPCAWLAVRLLGDLRAAFAVPLVLVAAMIGASVGAGVVLDYADRDVPVHARAEGARQFAAGRALTLLPIDFLDKELAYVGLPDAECLAVDGWAWQLPESNVALMVAGLAGLLRDRPCVLVPKPSMDRLELASRDPGSPPGVAALLRELKARFGLTPVRVGAFEGFELSTR